MHILLGMGAALSAIKIKCSFFVYVIVLLKRYYPHKYQFGTGSALSDFALVEFWFREIKMLAVLEPVWHSNFTMPYGDTLHNAIDVY